jgi:hypothetical protein
MNWWIDKWESMDRWMISWLKTEYKNGWKAGWITEDNNRQQNRD